MEEILIRCEGSTQPPRGHTLKWGFCPDCGEIIRVGNNGLFYRHDRRDVLAMLENEFPDYLDDPTQELEISVGDDDPRVADELGVAASADDLDDSELGHSEVDNPFIPANKTCEGPLPGDEEDHFAEYHAEIIEHGGEG